MALIAATPNTKLTSAIICLFNPLRHIMGSMTKSPASISTHAAYMSIPADVAERTPCICLSWGEPGEVVEENAARPIQRPVGVVRAKVSVRRGLRTCPGRRANAPVDVTLE